MAEAIIIVLGGFNLGNTQLVKTRYSINLAIHQALREGKITIPFPQRDVHLIPKP